MGGDGSPQMPPRSITAPPLPGKRPEECLSIEFWDSCAVDMDGMSPVVPGSNVALMSLDNFDADREFVPDDPVLTSPRSIEACLRLGVLPKELLKSAPPVDRGEDPEVVGMRLMHSERRRRQKLKAVRDERLAIMSEQSLAQHGGKGGESNGILSTMIMKEEEQMQRILAANQSQHRQQLTHEERMKQNLQIREARLAVQRAKDEAQKESNRKEMKARMAEQERKLVEGKMRREREEQEHLDMVLRRQQQFAGKEAERTERMMEQARMREEQHLLNQQNAQERQEQIRMVSRQIVEERRQMYEYKQARADKSRTEFETFRDAQRQKQRDRIEAKEARIEEAQARGAEIQAGRVRAALEKQARAEETRRKFEEERERVNALKRERESQREEQRELAYTNAKEDERQKVERILKKQQQTEANQQRLEDLRRREARLKDQDLKLKNNDKQDNVQRMRRVVEFQKFRTLKKIEAKREKSDFIKQEREAFKERKRQQREEIDRSKQHFSPVGPGPGEYLGCFPPTDRNSPAFVFGISRPDVDKSQMAEPGVESPGPAAYCLAAPTDKKAWTFPRSNRFKGWGSCFADGEDNVFA